MGIVICILGGIAKNQEIFDSNSDLREIGDIAFYVILAMGLTAIIMGLFGFITVKC